MDNNQLFITLDGKSLCKFGEFSTASESEQDLMVTARVRSALRTTRWRFSIGYVSSGSVISNSERRHLECETFPPRENDEFESIKVFCVARDKGPMTSNINNVFPKVIARTKRAALLLSCGTQNKFTLPQPPTKAEAINLHFAVAPLG